MPLPVIAAIIGAAATAYAAKKSADAQEKAARDAAAGSASSASKGDEDPFGDTSVQEMMGQPQKTMPFEASASPEFASMAMPMIAAQVPPQPAQPASTYSGGVDTQNIAPPVGGVTGDIGIGGAMPLNLENSMGPEATPSAAFARQESIKNATQGVPPMLADPNNPLNDPAYGTGEKLNSPPPNNDPRMQDYMNTGGQVAGLAGAAYGASKNANRAPGSGGFPGGSYHFNPSLAAAARYNDSYRRR